MTRPSSSTLPAIFDWALLLALSFGAVHVALAQHEFDTETWIEMRKMFREKGPTPTIEEDVAALTGRGARRAGPRLIDRGPEVLPAVHSAILAPDVEPRHALTLLQVIGPISHESSVPVLLELLRRDGKSPPRRDTLLILAMLPATDEAAAYIQGVASNDGEPWRTRRMAYTWYGFQRDPRGRPFAEAILVAPDPEHRAAGLYVLARLGDRSALAPIGQMLASGAPANARDVLFLGLAELATPDEFVRLAPAAFSGGPLYKDALRYVRYRAAPPDQRPPLCLKMLRAQMPGHLRIGVRCLLETGHADDLRAPAALDLEAPGRAALIRNEIRKAGWRVVDTDTEFRIEPGP